MFLARLLLPKLRSVPYLYLLLPPDLQLKYALPGSTAKSGLFVYRWYEYAGQRGRCNRDGHQDNLAQLLPGMSRVSRQPQPFDTAKKLVSVLVNALERNLE